jgi:ABC-2 type transport system ATP-binding protein
VAWALKARRLGRVYRWRGGQNVALRDVDLEVPAGSVLGLIGRNGAGKTTFIRIGSTSLLPTSGALEVLGRDVVAEAPAIRRRIAVIPQESRPFYWMTPRELVRYYLRLRGHSGREASRRAQEALNELGLSAWSETLVSRLSGGLRRRAMVAMVMASDAEILFLDEPTTGLDPLARRSVWEAIRRAAESHRTIFLTTHYLEEAEYLSDRLALLERGQLLAQGTPRDLSARVRYPFRVMVESGFSREELESYGRVSSVGTRLFLFTDEDRAQEVAREGLARGARLHLGPVSLEDIFVQIVGREISEDEGEGGEGGVGVGAS